MTDGRKRLRDRPHRTVHRRSSAVDARPRHPDLRRSPTSTMSRRASTTSTTRPSRPRSATTTPGWLWPTSRPRPGRRSAGRPRPAADQGRHDVRDQVADSIVAAQYQGQALSATGHRSSSPTTPTQFLSSSPRSTSTTTVQADAVADFAARGRQARDAARRPPSARPTSIAKTKETLGKEKAIVDAKLAEAKELLGQLEAEERAPPATRPAGERPRRACRTSRPRVARPPRSTTRWPRSATPTSTAPPAPAPSTAPA